METPVTTLARVAASNLRAEMGRRRLKVGDLASALQISRPTARSRMSGESAMTIGELEAVATWLDVTPLSLLAPASQASAAA